MRLELLSTRVVGDDREYRYNAVFQNGTFVVLLGLAPDDKVSAFGLGRRDPPP